MKKSIVRTTAGFVLMMPFSLLMLMTLLVLCLAGVLDRNGFESRPLLLAWSWLTWYRNDVPWSLLGSLLLFEIGYWILPDSPIKLLKKYLDYLSSTPKESPPPPPQFKS